MRRFLAFWIILTPACWLAIVVVSLAVFRHADLSYATFAVLVTAPVLQALVLAAATSRVQPGSLATVIATTLREPLMLPVLLIDLLLIGAGWLWPQQPAVGWVAGIGTQTAWLGSKGIVAGVLLARVGARRPGQVWLLAAAVAMGAVGAQAFVPWIEPAAAALPLDVGNWPKLYRWLASYGLPFLLLNALILRAGSVFGRRTATDFWLQTAVALNFVIGLIVVHGFFGLPYLVEPWRSLAWTAGSLAATALLLAALMGSGQSAEEAAAEPGA